MTSNTTRKTPEREIRYAFTPGKSYSYPSSDVDYFSWLDAVRSPDDAKIKQKMLFASSRDALRRSLVGIAVEIQGTDYSEVARESGKYFWYCPPLPKLIIQCSA